VDGLQLDKHSFARIAGLMRSTIGLAYPPAKMPLMSSRLSPRIQRLGLPDFEAYARLIEGPEDGGEFQMAVDLLTTNETYFFREPKHFDLLRKQALAARTRSDSFRVWSAASSSGEEAYSIAMVLADCLEERPWEIVGSDISTRVLERARTGHYVEARTRNIPPPYLKRFCLKGTGKQAGTVLVERGLRGRVSFVQVNLNEALPQLGRFDVIFLRNVMIYFNNDTKRQVVARVLDLLKPGGHFLIGHSESLNDINSAVEQVAPSIYRKP